MENKKYYTNSSGEQIDISTLHDEHLLNALNKKQKDVFYSEDKDEIAKGLEEIKNLKEEMHRRFNEKYEKLKG